MWEQKNKKDDLKAFIMLFPLFVSLLTATGVENVDIKRNGCESIPLSHEGSKRTIICSGNFTQLDKLNQYLVNITDIITVFQLEDAKLDVLPPDVFQSVQNPLVENIIFSNVNMELLSVPELGPPPFDSVKKTVRTLEIYNSSKVFAWDFESLEFEDLENCVVENSEIIAIKNSLTMWPHLRFIQLQNASIKFIHEKVFEMNTKLTICSLAHNKITRISRSMFPEPATKLYSIDLSFNRLEWLPDDAFSNMAMLTEVKLDNNRLRKVSSKTLKPVYDQLTQLWIDGNDIFCDSLCWMAAWLNKPMFVESSNCKTHRKLALVDSYFTHCKQEEIDEEDD